MEKTPEYKKAIEHVEYLKLILTCYEEKHYGELMHRYLKHSCKGMKNVYKGYILVNIRKSLEVAV